MEKEDVRLLRSYVIEMKIKNIGAKLYMYKEYMFLLMNALIQKGFNDNFVIELNKMKNEYMDILSLDSEFMGYILRNASKYDSQAVDEVLEKLDIIMDRTIDFYYDLLDDIEGEIFYDRAYPYKRIRKKFDTIIETDEYIKEVKGLNLTFADVKNYLNYEEDFWKFISNKIHTIDNPYEDFDNKMHFYGVWYTSDIDTLRVCIPSIVDLKTAQIVVHELKHAHDIYCKKIDSEDLESDARLEEVKFKNACIVLK